MEPDEEQRQADEGQEAGEMTLREAESVLGVSRTHLLKLIAAGELASEKRLSDRHGSVHVVRRDEVERLLRERQERAEQQTGRGRRIKVPKPPGSGGAAP